ncbi:MAG TPA: signal peptidase I [Candidatus Saccharimonadales bacterium]|nr:signal peptidase I [Candidatus Saccharimonadales bacterium]
MRLLGVLLWSCIQIAATVVLGVALIWLGLQQAFGLKLYDVQTGSMRPSFCPGDALVVQGTTLARIGSGDIITYHSPKNPHELITHRVVRLWPEAGRLQTQGDALGVPDPAVPAHLLAGKVRAVVPGLGGVFDWTHSWPGLAATVYLPAAIIAASELIRLEQNYFRANYYRLNAA